MEYEDEVMRVQLSDNARVVLAKRYLRGQTPEQRFQEIAIAIAAVEETSQARVKYQRAFYAMMASMDFLPNSPTISNAGRELGQLAGCFVLPIEDHMSAIFMAIHNTAMVHKSGGGTGFSFSRLRPKGEQVSSTSGVASGPISFMRVFNAATEEVKQGGTRRGANMGILRVDHPDIEEFIECKTIEGQLSNFNISVGITNEFMTAVHEDAMFPLRWNGAEYKSLRARYLFDMIVAHAWKNGEPGVVFLDLINDNNPTDTEIEATNPCGEQPLLPNESCNLGSINLANMTKPSSTTVGKFEVDYKKLDRVTRLAVRFMDNIIDVMKFPLPEIEAQTKKYRKIGLGVMGWADMLITLGIAYASDEAINLAEKVMCYITDTAHTASEAIAEEKGGYPARKLEQEPLRNATCTTIAPTGTLSMIASCSSGVEPIFGINFTKTVLDGTSFHDVNKHFKEEVRANYSLAEEIIAEALADNSVKDIKELSEPMKRRYLSAPEIPSIWHIKMQAAFQRFTDNAVSKTINFANSATEADVNDAILKAYELKCKGLTVYRVGSREAEVLTSRGKPQPSAMGTNTVAATKEKIFSPKAELTPKTGGLPIKPRPATLPGITRKMRTGCGKLYITVNHDKNNKIFETFMQTGDDGGCAAYTSGMSRMISMALRAGVQPKVIIDQLCSVKCESFTRAKGKDSSIVGKSCPDVIGRVLRDELNNLIGSTKDVPDLLIELYSDEGLAETVVIPQMKCPEQGCGNILDIGGGCVVCTRCGYSKCS